MALHQHNAKLMKEIEVEHKAPPPRAGWSRRRTDLRLLTTTRFPRVPPLAAFDHWRREAEVEPGCSAWKGAAEGIEW